MDFSFAPEERALAGSFGDFLRREVVPEEERLKQIAAESDGNSPRLREAMLAVRRRSAELGFYSVDMPVEAGGGGLSFTGAALLREVAASTGSFLAVACLAGHEGPTPLLMELPAQVRERILPGWLRAETSGAIALTEPDAGSDNQSMKTRAQRRGDGWVINGTNHFITNGQHADYGRSSPSPTPSFGPPVGSPRSWCRGAPRASAWAAPRT